MHLSWLLRQLYIHFVNVVILLLSILLFWRLNPFFLYVCCNVIIILWIMHFLKIIFFWVMPHLQCVQNEVSPHQWGKSGSTQLVIQSTYSYSVLFKHSLPVLKYTVEHLNPMHQLVRFIWYFIQYLFFFLIRNRKRKIYYN